MSSDGQLISWKNRHDVTSPFPSEIQASQIYHLACPASPIHFTKTPISILETCYQGTRNALEAARDWKATLLLASTSEIYGDAQVCPQPESYHGNVNCFGPRSCYDEGKRVAEAMVYAYRLEHGLDLKVARIFNAYGPGMRGTDGRVISSFISQALHGKDVIIYGQGDATRSFQYAEDCVGGLQALMESIWVGGPINIGCETETSITDLAELVVQRVSKLAGVEIANIRHGDQLPDEPLLRKPDCALAKRVLGWSSKTDLAEGLDRTIKWHMQIGAMSNRASL